MCYRLTCYYSTKPLPTLNFKKEIEKRVIFFNFLKKVCFKLSIPRSTDIYIYSKLLNLTNADMGFEEIEAKIFTFQFGASSTINLLMNILNDLEKKNLERLALVVLIHLTKSEQLLLNSKNLLLAVKLLARLQSLKTGGHFITKLNGKNEEIRLIKYFR